MDEVVWVIIITFPFYPYLKEIMFNKVDDKVDELLQTNIKQKLHFQLFLGQVKQVWGRSAISLCSPVYNSNAVYKEKFLYESS